MTVFVGLGVGEGVVAVGEGVAVGRSVGVGDGVTEGVLAVGEAEGVGSALPEAVGAWAAGSAPVHDGANPQPARRAVASAQAAAVAARPALPAHVRSRARPSRPAGTDRRSMRRHRGRGHNPTRAS